MVDKPSACARPDEPVLGDAVARAAGGDVAALKLLLVATRGQLVRRIAPRIPAELCTLIDVDDIVQETHVEVFRGIKSLQVQSIGAFRRWISTIALNRLRTLIRRQRAARRGGGFVVMRGSARSPEDSKVELLEALIGLGTTPSGAVARAEAIDAVQARWRRYRTSSGRRCTWFTSNGCRFGRPRGAWSVHRGWCTACAAVGYG